MIRGQRYKKNRKNSKKDEEKLDKRKKMPFFALKKRITRERLRKVSAWSCRTHIVNFYSRKIGLRFFSILERRKL